MASDNNSNWGCLLLPIIVLIGIFIFSIGIFYIENLFKFLGAIHLMDVFVPLLTCITLGTIAWYIARKGSIKYRLTTLFFFFLTLIIFFALTYRWFYVHESVNAFMVNADYEDIYKTKKMEDNFKRKNENWRAIAALELIRGKEKEILTVVEKIRSHSFFLNNSPEHIDTVLLPGIIFNGNAFKIPAGDADIEERTFFVKSEGKILYDFSNSKDDIIDSWHKKFVNSATSAELGTSIIGMIDQYSARNINVNKESAELLRTEEINVNFSSFLLFSASTMIPVENPGLIPVKDEIFYLMFIQSILGLFLMGYGLQILWKDHKSP